MSRCRAAARRSSSSPRGAARLPQLPIFWDQHDNAQRIAETGFGARLDTYRHSGEELTAAIDRLLGDAPLRSRLAATSKRLQSARGTERAADLIEATARA